MQTFNYERSKVAQQLDVSTQISQKRLLTNLLYACTQVPFLYGFTALNQVWQSIHLYSSDAKYANLTSPTNHNSHREQDNDKMTPNQLEAFIDLFQHIYTLRLKLNSSFILPSTNFVVRLRVGA